MSNYRNVRQWYDNGTIPLSNIVDLKRRQNCRATAEAKRLKLRVGGYGRSYLARDDRVEFDQVELKLQEPVFRTTKLRGNFGALRDSSPDAWGRKLIETRLGDPSPSEIRYLLNSPDDQAGALGFRPERATSGVDPHIQQDARSCESH